MAFNTRFRRRRRFGRTGRFRARRFVRKVRRITKRTIKRMSEIKRVVITGTGGATTGYVVAELTPAITQGPNKNQRIGNKIQYKFLSLRVTASGLETDFGNVPFAISCRVVLFTTRNIVTAVTDVIEETLLATPAMTTIQVPLRSENVNVLKDWQFDLGLITSQTGYQTWVPTQKRRKFSMRLPRNVTFASSSTVQSSDPQDRIYLLLGSVSTTGTGQASFFWGGRLSYIDI